MFRSPPRFLIPRTNALVPRYGAALLAGAFALLITWWFPSLRRESALVFLAAVVITAWYCGLWPALLTTFVAAIADDAVLSQGFGIAIVDPQILLRVGLFIGVALLVSVFAEVYRHAEARAQAQWTQLHTMLASIGDGVIATDMEGRVTFVNAVAQSLTGWTEEVALGQQLDKVFPIMNEQTRQVVVNPIFQVLRERRTVGLANHTILIAKGGIERPIEDSAAPIRDGQGTTMGVVLIFRDVTEQRRADVTRAHLAAIVESSDDAIIGKDLDGTILSWNTGAEHIYGFAAAEVIGRSIGILLPIDRPTEASMILNQIKQGKHIQSFETTRIRKDGTQTYVSLTVSPINDATGAIIGASTIARDISARKLAAQALQRQNMFVHLLQTVAVAANQSTTIDDVLQTALDQICEHIGWPVGHVYLPAGDARQLLNRTNIWQLGDHQRFALFQTLTEVTLFASGQGLPGRVLATRKPAWSIDVTTDPLFPAAKLIAEIGIRASFAFPVLVGDDVVAVLEFFSADAVEPDTALLDVMANIGAQLGRVIERVQIRQALLESEERFRTLFEHSPDAILLIDPHHSTASWSIIECNTVLSHMSGYSRGELVGQSIDLLQAEVADPGARATHLDWLRSEGAYLTETIQHRKDGSRFPVEVSTALITLAKRELVLGVIRDITERKRTEEALAAERALLAQRVNERTADLQLANAELARAARLKDEFLASMSHELRTPLNAILGLSESLEEQTYGPLNEAHQKAIRIIAESGRHLLMLINDILDLAKIEAGKTQLDQSTVTVKEICQSSLNLIRETALQKRIDVTTTMDDAVSTIQADGRRMKQILVNLLSNAVKFTSVGGAIGLEVTGDMVRQEMHFIVWDTGIGIAPDDLPKLFQPFVQIDSRLAREHAGTGLGLALVANLVKLHGGTVVVASEVGSGSRFTVTLPWRTPLKVSHEAHTLRRALVVDESSPAANQLVHYLQVLAFETIIHSREQDVLMRALEFQPEVILLNVSSPALAGWDILAQLKAEPRTRTVPILIISAQGEQTQGHTQGATDALVMPVTLEQLQRTLEQITPGLTNDTTSHSSFVAPVLKQGGSPAIVLLVDDNESNNTMVEEYLQAKGYQVAVAWNGVEAIAQARVVQPDVILMDIQMPQMDGFEAIRHIRSDPLLATIPIIVLTALAMRGDRERCLAAGANDYLSKPASMKDIVAAIQRQLYQLSIV